MFNKINQLVKESTNPDVFLNAGILASAMEAANHEASGVIIDVMKSQLDNGKARDLMNVFKGKNSEYELLLNMMIKKYANRLNKYHGLSDNVAKDIAESVIPLVMKKLVSGTAIDPKAENGIFALFNWLSGYTVNFEHFFTKINSFTLA